ncbi:MAG: M6 family metalloprotease domain-containing protein [Prevotella sp.]|nr:M6 family metalloprotease domain-containing protein [Prevotella sp.]
MKSWRSFAATVLLLLAVVQAVAAGEGSEVRRGCRAGRMAQSLPAAMRRAATRSGSSASSNVYIGKRRQLVVLAAFADKAFAESQPIAFWDKVFNAPHFAEPPFSGSVRDYFYDQSYGQLLLQFDIHYVVLADSQTKYRSTDTDDENSQYLVCDIVDSLSARGTVDWSQYDWDGDGFVDQLLIVYAGKGMNDGGGSNTIWPHQWWLSLHDGCKERTVTAGGNSYAVDCYCCVQELTGRNTYGVFGTICHEYSHCFGLPDFYYGATSYVRNWDLMDYGNNNGSGFCPPGYSAHERMFMGWLDMPELTEPTQITGMQALSDSAQAYIIRNDAWPDEVYVVENRQQHGWDSSLPGSGIVIFHVDFDKDIWRGLTSEMVNSSKRKRYTIFAANNRSTSSGQAYWAYPYQGNDSLTNTSVPSASLLRAAADGTNLMSKPITGMSVDDGGLASFRFMMPETTGIDAIYYNKVSREGGSGSAGKGEDAAGVVYSLTGQRLLSPSRKGIYIVNGRKVLLSR